VTNCNRRLERHSPETVANTVLQRGGPWELRFLGYRPDPWEPGDVILIYRASSYVSLAQSQGDMERLLLEMVQAGVSRRHLDELFPGLLRNLDDVVIARLKLADRLVPEGIRWNTALPRAVASNNWVLAGSRTASGRALLANDPHLESNRLPAVWYEAVLELPDRFAIAATLPGMPGVALGRTNDLAWGATYTFMDAIDSWIEDCRDGCYRRTGVDGDTWARFRVRTETIHRKRKPSVRITVYENDHGVLNGDPTAPGFYLTTRWASGAGTGAASIEATFDMLHAADVATGMELLGKVETAWNFVLADRQGNIGYQMSGLLPRRPPGHDGLVPMCGWDPTHDWQGFVPPEDLPRTFNPECGFIVTANNDLNHLGRARPINLPMGAYRAERITECLRSRSDWQVSTVQQLQLDVVSPQAARFMTILRPLLPATPEARLLRDWDLRYDLESRGAVLFERFYRALIATVFGRVCGPDILAFLLDETGILIDFYANFDDILLRADSAWYGKDGRDQTFTHVASAALAGPAPTWGQTHQLTMRHLLFGGKLPPWLGFDRGPLPLRGNRATVHQGQLYRAGGRATSFAPSYRLITDLGEPVAYTALAGGPSDRRFSPWYTSGIADWVAGRLKQLRPGRGAA